MTPPDKIRSRAIAAIYLPRSWRIHSSLWFYVAIDERPASKDSPIQQVGDKNAISHCARRAFALMPEKEHGHKNHRPDESIDHSDHRFAAAHRVLADAVAAHAFPGCAFGVISADGLLIRRRWEISRTRMAHQQLALKLSSTWQALPRSSPLPASRCFYTSATTLTSIRLFSKLLPGFVVGRNQGDWARHVKLRHLLAHSSGLPGYVDFFRSATKPAGLYRACLQLPLEAEPGDVRRTRIPRKR